MHQGNWKCGGCGGTITELPFEPRSESGLTCRSCYGKQKDKEKHESPEVSGMSSEAPNDIPEDAVIAGEQAPESSPNTEEGLPTPTERPKFSGSWQCAGCGSAITSLPFEPRDTSNLKCLDCFKKSKG